MCAPSFVWLRGLCPPPEELLGVAPVFEDERNAGRPVYFCDVIVRQEAPIQTFSDLRGGSWTYNDETSLSGYYGLLDKLAKSGRDENERTRRVLQRFGLNRFVAVDRENYDMDDYQNLAVLLANPTT